MECAQRVPGPDPTKPQPLPSREAVATILWESVWNALFRAFLVQILGTVVISFLGDLLSEMAPSLPPGISHKPQAEVATAPVSHGLGTFVANNQFWLIFALLYFVLAATRFAPYLRITEHRKLVARLLWINRRISGQWFRLFVLNAITAWVSTMVFAVLQKISWTHIGWAMISGVVQPVFQTIAAWIPGGGSLGHWYSWYGQNQAKFVFWLLYSAAICDDLGLPNYKTFIRWAGRRFRRYLRTRFGDLQSCTALTTAGPAWSPANQPPSPATSPKPACPNEHAASGAPGGAAR